LSRHFTHHQGLRSYKMLEYSGDEKYFKERRLSFMRKEVIVEEKKGNLEIL